MAKPNVLIAGFPRCATTYLYDMLKQHKEISLSEKKEINFFNLKPYFLANPEIASPRIFKSDEWYFSHFKNNKVIIDFSVICSYDPLSIHRVKRILGDVKIIFITREKESHKRSISGLIELHGGNPNNPSVKKFSDFDRYILPYKQNFSKVFITSLEEVRTKEGMRKLLKFLEVEQIDFVEPEKDKYKLNDSEFSFFDKVKRNGYILLVRLLENFL